jgi:hypothetical protein
MRKAWFRVRGAGRGAGDCVHRLATATVTGGPPEGNIVVRGAAAYQLVTKDIRQII